MLSSLPKLAWRNLGRNLRRSLITGAALAFGISLCVASYGLVDGLSAQMLHALTKLDMGDVQVHNPDFAKRRSLRARIEDSTPLLAEADAIDGVVGVAPRVFGFALVSTDAKSTGVELVGIDPVREPKVTELDRKIKRGTYLAAEPTPWPASQALTAEEQASDDELTAAAEAEALAEIDALETETDDEAHEDDADDAEAEAPELSPEELAQRTQELAHKLSPPPDQPLSIMIGASLAKALHVDVGDEVYASTIRIDGVSEAVFTKVVGIYETGTQLLDRHRVYLHIADMRRLTALEDGSHEIAIVTDPPARAAEVATALQAKLGDGLLVRPWNVVRPDMQRMLDLNEVGTDLMVFIIFIVATLGVVNTMLMSVFERTRELGVLKAIGMSGGRVLALIVSETFLLVLASSAVGTLIGLGLDLYMVKYGFDLTGSTDGFSVGGVGINPIIYGRITLRGVVMPSLVLSISCLLASLYPAIRAARLQPAIGMRET